MLERVVKQCRGCPYEPIDLQFGRFLDPEGKTQKVNAFDVDLVIEVGKRIRAVLEMKRYQDAASYRHFYMPAGEYVGVKKVAKSLHVPFVFLISDGSRYFVTEVDRFSCLNSIMHNGKRVIAFPREKFVQLDPAELKEWFLEVL